MGETENPTDGRLIRNPECADGDLPLRSWPYHSPTRKDALTVAVALIGMLAEALPIALRAVGSLSVEVQVEFWREWAMFDQQLSMNERDKFAERTGHELSCLVEVAFQRARGNDEDLNSEMLEFEDDAEP